MKLEGMEAGANGSSIQKSTPGIKGTCGVCEVGSCKEDA